MACPKCSRELDVSEVPPFTQIECPECGQVAEVPARLGNFILLRLIGTGGMGGVYHAIDESLGRDVAIKVMLKSLGDDQEFVDTFRREAQAAAQLNHPNVAQIYSFGQEQGQPYIVMELVSGKRLDKMMEKQGALDQSFMVRVILEIAQGLSAAGDIGLIHGDIKPENILFDEKGQAKLVDFGLASFVHQQAAGGIWGTPYYIAPEKVRRQRIDARADIYSLGATFYHAITGKPPFEGHTPVEVVKARLKALPPTPSDAHDGIAPRVSDIVMRMLQTSPTRRYPTYASLMSDLKRAADDLPPPRNLATTRSFKKRVKSKRRTTDSISTPRNGASTSSTSPRIVINKTSSAEESPIAEYAHHTESPEELVAKKQKRSAVVGSILALVILAALGGGGFFGYLKYTEAKELRELRAAYRGKMQTAEELYAEFWAGVTNVSDYIGKSAPIRASVTNDINATTSSALDNEPPPETGYADLRGLQTEFAQSVATIRKAHTEVRGYGKRIDLILKDMKASWNLEEADERLDKIRETIESVQEAANRCEEQLKIIEEKAAAIHVIRTKVVEDRAAAATAAAEEAKRKEEERKRLEEEERKKRERDAELARANSALESVEGFTKSRNYQRAANVLRTESDSLKLDEARNIVKPSLDRLNHLIDLQKGIVAMLAAAPLKWGWIQDGQPLDVLTATDESVQIKGGRKVPWPQVNMRQMFKFVQHYVELRGGSSRVRAKRKLEAAVFCFVSADTDAARKQAREYADRAAEMVPSLDEEAARLVPRE